MGGHDDVVRFLVDTAKVNIFQPDLMGRTALTHARENGHPEIADWLNEQNEHLHFTILRPPRMSAAPVPSPMFGFAEVKWISAPTKAAAVHKLAENTAPRCLPRRRSQTDVRRMNMALQTERARVQKLESLVETLRRDWDKERESLLAGIQSKAERSALSTSTVSASVIDASPCLSPIAAKLSRSRIKNQKSTKKRKRRKSKLEIADKLERTKDYAVDDAQKQQIERSS